MDLSAEQRDALSHCEAILTGVGLLPRVLDTSPSPSHTSSRASTPSTPSSYISSFDCPPCPAVLASRYIPPPARLFTREERDCHANRVTRRMYVDGIIEHPLDAIVKYPQTGSHHSKSIAHIFTSVQLSFTLSDLHLSLTNLDHLRRIINVLCTEKYPDGTGFEGNDSSFCVPLIMINDI